MGIVIDTSSAPLTEDPTQRLRSVLTRRTSNDQARQAQMQNTGSLGFSYEIGEQDNAPGIAESIRVNTLLNSITGSFAQFVAHKVGDALDSSNVVDPNFDPYKLYNDKFDSQFPFMAEDFQSGRVLDFPNEQSFWTYVQRKEADYYQRVAMSKNGFLKNFATSVPGQLLDIGTGTALVKVFGLTGQAATLSAALRSGNFASRSAKMALVGGSVNAVQEQILHGLNPDRNEDEVRATLWAAGMGAAFGGAFSGMRSVKNTLNTAQTSRLRDDIIEAQKPPEVRYAFELAESEPARLRELLESDDPPLSINAISTPQTEDLIKQLKVKWGDNIEISSHPLQESVDTARLLAAMEKELDKFAPDGAGPVSGKFADLMAAVAPGSKLRKSPSSLMQRFHRLMFDDTTTTRESVRNPLTNETLPPAEAIKWNYDAWRDTATIGVDDAYDRALKLGGVTHTLSNGDTITLRSRMPGQRKQFRMAVVDWMRATDKAKRKSETLPEAGSAVREAAEAIRTYTQRMGDEALAIRLLDEDVHGRKFWLPRRWRSHEIQTRAVEFKQRLLRQFRENDRVDFNNGTLLTESTRLVNTDVFKYARGEKALTPDDIKQLKKLSKENLDNDLVERHIIKELGEDVYARYRQELELYWDGAADATIDSLTDVANAHGVQHTFKTAFARQKLDIDEQDFTDFLESDLDDLLQGYHRQTAGKIATRYTLSRDADALKAIRELTGKNAAEHGYDPMLMVESIKRQFQELLKIAEKTKNTKLQKQLLKGQAHVEKILLPKLAELEGRPFLGGNPAGQAGWMQFAGRQLLRFPPLAWLGKVTVSNVSDLSSVVLTGALRPGMISKVARALNLFKEVPRRQLESLYVAMSDYVHTSRIANTLDLDDISRGAEFGKTGSGQFMAAVDRGMDAVTSTFFRLTGINRWNTNMKRTMARVVMSDMIIGAKKMSRAGKLIAEGMDEKAAMRKVGLTLNDAAQFNRLGLTSHRADALIKQLRKHGVDWEGNQPWKNAKDPEKAFDDYKGDIGPEFNKWFNEDRDTFDMFTTATNRMVLDVVTEPKLMSKPVMNGELFGRLFNQFSSFAFAWGNQTAQLAARRPAYEQVQAFIIATGFAGLADAIHNQLAGRRSFNESAQLWSDNPRAAMYGAFNRSPLLGWLARPVGLIDQTPWGPGRLLGNTELSGTFSRPIEPTGVLLGPAGSWLDQSVIAIMKSAYQGELGPKQQRQLWNTMPYHNLWFVEATLRLAEKAGIDTPTFVKPRR